jgi:hypothetical protein
MAVTRASTSKDYSAIAKSKIRKPSQAPPRGKSILIYARNKKGKTRFCATAPNVLILDPERGTDEYTKLDPDVWPIDRWEDLDEVYKFLRGGKHSYEYVAFDGMTRFSNMALRFVMAQAEEHDLSRKPGMVQQRDYGKSGELMKGLMYNFHNLDVGTIYTAQERQVEGEFGEEDDDAEAIATQYVADLPKGVRAAVNGIVDVIGRLYTIRTEDNEGKTVIRRRLWIAPSPVYDTGYRSDYKLPEYLSNPTVPRLVDLIEGNK